MSNESDLEERILLLTATVSEPRQQPSHKYIHMLYGIVLGIAIGHATLLCAPSASKVFLKEQKKWRSE
jgi:uncharacterized membrane protein YccC